MTPPVTASPLTASQIALAEVAKPYGDRMVLDRLSLTVRLGEKVGVVGGNGSGKRTLLRLLTLCDGSIRLPLGCHQRRVVVEGFGGSLWAS